MKEWRRDWLDKAVRKRTDDQWEKWYGIIPGGTVQEKLAYALLGHGVFAVLNAVIFILHYHTTVLLIFSQGIFLN